MKTALWQIVTWATLLASPAFAHNFYVAADGDDANPGTRTKPFATLERARDAIREMKAAGPLAERTDVIVRGGTYFLHKTFRLTTRDSGTAKAPIIYRAAEGEHVVCSGGRPVTGPWQTEDGKIFYTDLPEARAGKWNFRQLFVNGRRATWARYPNGNGTIKVMAKGEDNFTLHVKPGAAKTIWAQSPGALIDIVAGAGWFNELVQIASVSDDGSTIKIQGREAQGDVRQGNAFFVEGVKSELDQPGEWWLDTVHGRLYYWPPNGDPAQLQIVAPVLDRAVELDGDHDGAARIQYVTLKDFTFADLDFTVGQLSVRTTQDAAVRLVNAWHCGVANCRFTDIGGYGVWLHLDSRFNRITGNEMSGMGSGGVLLTSARFAYATDEMIYDPNPAVAGLAPLRNEITHNVIHDGGVIRRYCSGVHLDSRPLSTALDAGNLVAHNLIYNMPRNGIFAFRNQGGNIFEYNNIHDVMQVVEDGGAIHIATMNPLAAPIIVRGNYIHNVGHDDVLANGIYPDWFSSHLRVEDNIVDHTSRGAIKMLGGDDNTFVNNIIANDTQASIVAVFFGVKHLTGDRIERNIVVNDRPDATAVRFSAYPYLTRKEAAGNPKVFAAMRDNLYWNTAGPVKFSVNGKGGDAVMNFRKWQATGADAGSLVGDPLFVDPARRNFAFPGGSPVRKIGFVPIDMSEIGPEGTTAPSVSFDQLQRDAIIVSDEDKGRVEAAGNFSTEHVVLAGQKHTFLTQLVLRPTAANAGFIRFKPHVPTSGKYDLWVRWFPSQRTNSTRTPLLFHTSAGPQRLVLDQRQEAIKWLHLGAYHFDAGETVDLTFSGKSANGAVVAKAVALVKQR